MTEDADGALLENNETHHQSGAVTFTDVDLSDLETSSIANTQVSATLAHSYALTSAQHDALVNAFTIGSASHSTTDGGGSIAWHYDLADSAIDFLGANDVVTLTYTVQVDDGHGGIKSQDVTVTVHGTEDKPVITSGAQSGLVTEDADGALLENNETHHQSGAVTFTDVDLSDLETSSIANTQVSATLAHAYALTSAQHDALVNAFTIGAASHSTTDGGGSIAWHYDLADSAIDFLGANDVVTLTYTVQVDDGNGGIKTQDVSVTVHGTEDKPVITSGAQSGSVTEDADGSLLENAETHHQSGAVTFTDVDLSDAETRSITNTVVTATLANGYTLTAAQHDALVNAFTLDAATHSSVTGNGTIGWHYDIADSAIDFLGASDQVVLTYTVQVDDGNGGTKSQDVTVTVHGAEDKPVLAVDASGPHNITERVLDTNDSTLDQTSGTLSFTDVDLSDTHTLSQGAPTFNWVGHSLTNTQISALTAASTLLLSETDSFGSGTGSIGFTYKAADKTFDFLADGDTLTVTYNVTVKDNLNQLSTQPVTITITGSNDAPVVKYNGAFVLDQFNTRDYGAWVEQNDDFNAINGSAIAGEFQVAHDPSTAAGNFQIKLTDLDDETGVPDLLTRTVNLTGATAATLTFDYRRDIPNGETNDKFFVLASTDGVNFTQIGQIGTTGNGSFVDGAYQTFTFDLTPYISAHTMIQFSVGDDVDDGDIVYVDNFKIAYSTAAAPTQSVNYTENSAVGVFTQITDVDNGAVIHSASVTVTNHHANDLLSVTGSLPGGISASSYNALTGVLTLTGTASLADYQTALSHIIFSNTSDNPDVSDRALTVTVNDGLADSNLATTTIHVTAIDDAPTATADNVITNFGNGNLFQIPDSALIANDTDPDNTLAQLSVTNVSNQNSGTAGHIAGAATFTDSGGTSGGSFDYTLSDGGAVTSTAHVTVTDVSGTTLNGTAGNDIFIAKAGGSTMNGNGGNDVFIGNTGADIMNGGSGNDTFVFKATTDSTSGAGHFDTVNNFTHGSDHLDFTAIAGATQVQANAVAAAGLVDAHSISWFVDSANNQTIVYVNTTNTANTVSMEVHLAGVNVNLAGSDILHHT